MPFRREAGRVVDAPRCQVLARFKVPPVVVRQDDDLVEAVVEPLERMAEVTGEMGALEPEVVFIGRVGPGDDSGAGGKPRPEQGEQQGVLKAGPEDDGVILVAVDVVRRFLKECVYRRKAYARAPAEEENRGVRVTSLSITERLIFS